MRPARLGAPSAWYGHVPFAHWLIGALRPAQVVELGTHNGVSYAAFCEAVARTGIAARCTAVDTWQGDEHAGHYGDAVLEDLRRFHDPRYGSFSELLRCTFDAARPFVTEASVDLLHIDGLHTYDAVRHDWEVWRPTLSEHALVLFHDTNERQGSFGVWRLWEELSAAHPSFTFLHGHGLGVLAPGRVVPQAMRQLRRANPASVRARFSLLGERWNAEVEQHAAIDARQRSEAANAGLRAEHAAAARQLAEIRQAHAAAEARAVAAERALIDAEDEADRSRTALATTRTRAATLATEIARAAGERESLLEALAFRASEWERVHGVMATRDAERAALQARLDAIERTASWQVTEPLRALERSAPGLDRAGRKLLAAARLAASGELGRSRALRRRRRDDAASVRSSRLFDPIFYRATTPDLGDADPVEHFVWVGAARGAMPNAAFDTAWYVARNPGLADSGENPLLHWQRAGAASGQDPGPLFDARWYAARHKEAAADPLLHYLETGGPQRLDPNPVLDAEAYLPAHADARASGRSALEHWVRVGAKAGLDPHPLFDAGWYRAQHGLGADADPLAHWLGGGRQAGLPTSALVERAACGLRPVRFPPVEAPAVSIIVPAWRHLADTWRCLFALMANSGETVPFEVLVADDDPDAPIAGVLEMRCDGVHVHRNPANLGFLLSCNAAAARARGGVLVFLNNDTEVRPGWLDAIMSLLAARPDAGMVGCKLINRDGTVQDAGGTIGPDGWGVPYGSGGDPDDPEFGFVREVDVVVGAAIAVRREAWEAAGGFDPSFAPAFYEEFDLAFALRKHGWRVFYQPDAVVDHLGSNSYGAAARDRQSARNHARFCRKWAAELREQPAPGTSALKFRSRPHTAKTMLFIDDRVPEWDRHAGALTNRQYLGLWQSLGYDIVFAPVADPRPSQPYTRALQQMGIEMLHPPGTLEAWLARHGAAVDLVWTARPDVTAPLLGSLRAHTTAPILYYPHDLHHLRERRRWELEGNAEALDESERYRRLERRIFTEVDRVLAISEEEADVIRALAPDADVRLVPAYLYPAPPEAPPASALAERDAILFVGGYVHPPNLDAARHLATEIMPLVWREEPRIRLILAGSSPPAEIRNLSGPNVEVPGFLADLAPLTARARLSVSPLRYGAGVKGKVVAALWDGLPVVCTTVANEGLGLVDGTEAAVADTAAEFASRIVALWRDPAAAAALARGGQEVVRRRFTIDAAAAAMSRIVAAGRRRPAVTGNRSSLT